MKKRIFSFICFMILSFMMIGIFSVQNIAVAEENSYKSFYSTENKPLFYGATEITIDKNVVSTFDEKDARFRIMARDFEDGDLTYKIICTKNNVVPTTVGEYELIYSVTDSHKNTSTITVPVHVLDKEEGECKIVRTIYSMPSLWNLSLVGTERCNNGDRQILGIYLPESASAEIRSIDAEADLQITYFTNTKVKNSFCSVKISNTDFQTVKNVASDGNSYDAVPLITSPRLKTNEIDKTFKIEIKFKEDVKALDYYHYKDDEQAFKDSWKVSQNSFGVVDGEAMILVVPFADVDKLSGYTAPNYYSPFASLDAFFEFYLEVVNRYDKMLGLEFDAKEEIDQNFRIKYTAVADASSSAGAYYAGGYIAVCRDTISPIFQYGWGTLHEIAHGYQGTLGRGVGGGENLCLNETGNNILAHYIQMDESIYLNPNKSKYLGKLENAEQNQNQSRYNKIADGTGVFNNSGGTYTNITEKMFCIINLLDKFEGPETYGKLFKYYRRIVQKYGNNTFRISDVYAKFFAEEYNVNIIPYLKAWTMTLSENVEAELFEKDLKVMNIFADILSETNFEEVSTDNNFNLKFGLYDESILDDYNIKTNLNLNLEIDNFSEIKGRYLAVIKNNEVVKTVKIISKNLQITDLPVGYQQILFPYDFGMNNKLCSFVLKEGENSVSYKFEKYGTPKFSEYKSTIKIFGIYNTVGLSVEFDNFYKTAKFTPGGADLGNRNATWAGKMDETYISVTIKDEKGSQVQKIDVKGNQYFTDVLSSVLNLDLEYGWTVEIYTPRPNLVGVFSQITGSRIADYNCTDNTIIYEVTKEGLVLKNKQDFNVKDVLCSANDSFVKQYLDEYIANVSDEELEYLRKNTKTKYEVVSAYNLLSSEDKSGYSEFINNLLKGKAPVISAKNDKITIKQGAKIDLYGLVSISDFEDFVIDADSDFVKIETSLNTKVAGEYDVVYSVKDSSGNNVTKTIKVVVEKDEAFEEEQIKEGLKTILLVAGIIAVFVVIMIIVLKITKKEKSKGKKKVN